MRMEDGKFHIEYVILNRKKISELTLIFYRPEIFHSLHCLNAIRKHLDKEYYQNGKWLGRHRNFVNASGLSDSQRIYLDYCLDHIFQTITCQGDLSPLPIYKREGFPMGIGVGQKHTCRKLQPILDWVDKRAKIADPLEDSE